MRHANLLGTTAMLAMVAAGAATPFPAQSAPKPRKLDHYEVYSLPNPLGGTYAQGTSINLENDIAGFATLPGNAVMHAMLWRNRARPKDMGTLGGPNSAVAWPNRNDNGQYAGVSETAATDQLGEAWSCAEAVFNTAPPTGNVCLGFRWKNGSMSGLPTLGGVNGFATGINNDGEIVGWAETPVEDESCIAPQVLQFEAVIWNANDLAQALLPYGADPDSAATAINDSGQVVGISGLCANAVGGASAEHMVLWQNGTASLLPGLGGQYWNTPMDINEKGDVTGFSDFAGDGVSSPNFNAFLWTKKYGTQGLGTLAGDTVSEGLGINDADQIVGVSYPSGHAFLWQNGTMTDLNALISTNAPVLLTDAQDINDDGVITGEAQNKTTGAITAFVAVPEWK